MVDIFNLSEFVSELGRLADYSEAIEVLTRALGDFKSEGAQAIINDEKEVVFKGSDDGSYTSSDLKKLAEGDLSSAKPQPPDLLKLKEALGIDLPDDALSSLKDQDFRVKKAFFASKAFADASDLGRTQDSAAAAGLKDPSSPEDLAKSAAADKVKQVSDSLTTKNGTWRDDIKSVGKWVATKLPVGSILGAGAFYYLVQKHQAEMSGCWLINTGSGDKCKIKQLTAGAAATSTSTSCDMCVNLCDGNCKDGQFNPCPLPLSAPKDWKCTDQSGGGVSASNCYSCSQSSSNCSIPTFPAGNNASCDGNCSCSKYYCGQGYQMKCVNATFWDSVTDIGRSVLGPAYDLGKEAASSLLKIVFIVVGIAAGIGLIFFILKSTVFSGK